MRIGKFSYITRYVNHLPFGTSWSKTFVQVEKAQYKPVCCTLIYFTQNLFDFRWILSSVGVSGHELTNVFGKSEEVLFFFLCFVTHCC